MRIGSHLESQRRKAFQEEEVACDAIDRNQGKELAANRSLLGVEFS